MSHTGCVRGKWGTLRSGVGEATRDGSWGKDWGVEIEWDQRCRKGRFGGGGHSC